MFSGANFIIGSGFNAEVLGNVLVGLSGRIASGKQLHISASGDVLNMGKLVSGEDIEVVANYLGNTGLLKAKASSLNLEAKQDIINIGAVEVAKGNAVLKAGRDIKELRLARGAKHWQSSGYYLIDGNLYYEAGRDIVQEGMVHKVGGDIHQSAGFAEEVKRAEVGKRYYLIERGMEVIAHVDEDDGVLLNEMDSEVVVKSLQRQEESFKAKLGESASGAVEQSYEIEELAIGVGSAKLVKVIFKETKEVVYLLGKKAGEWLEKRFEWSDESAHATLNDQYQEAMRGGRHSGWAKQYLDKPTNYLMMVY